MTKTPMILHPATDDLLFHTQTHRHDDAETEYDAEIQRRIFDAISVRTMRESTPLSVEDLLLRRCEIREKRWSIMTGNRFRGMLLIVTEYLNDTL
jgi:hypothetical protein